MSIDVRSAAAAALRLSITLGLAIGLAFGPASPAAAQRAPADQPPGSAGQPPDPSRPSSKQPVPLPKANQDGAQGNADAAKAKRPKFRMPGASIPHDPTKRARLLKDLYAFLATAETEESGKAIADAIERVWVAGAGPTVKVLFDRAEKATAAKDTGFALRMLDAVTKIAPDFPEAFNRRAFVHYQADDVERALGDLRRAIALDPNHFKSLDGLGQILREMGRKKQALAVYRKLYEVYPHWPGAKSAVDELTREADGESL